MTEHLMGFIYWNVGPDLFRWGPIAIRWYGLLFALGFYIGFFIVRGVFRDEHKSEESLNSLMFYMVGGAVIGARLGHCFFYEPGYYFKHPLQIFAVWEGGLASHGGAVGVLLALYFYQRRHRDQPYLWLLDRVVVPTALAGALIRLGNMFNSELVGTPTQVPWAFVFVRVDAVPRHPVQLYESFAYLITFVVLMWVYNRMRARTPQGLIFGMFLVFIFTARFFLEFFKTRQAAYENAFPLSVGQLLSIPFVLAGAYLWWRALRAARMAHPSAPNVNSSQS